MFEERTFITDFNAAAFVVRAHVLDSDKIYRETSFANAEIERISAMKQDVSVIVLRSGLRILVDMPYADLEKEVFFRGFRASPVLDLRAVTGAPVEHKTCLQIKVMARLPNSLTLFALSFYDNEVNMDELATITASTSATKKAAIRFSLLEKQERYDREFVVDIPKDEFLDLYLRAKRQAADQLDLRNWGKSRRDISL